MGGRTGSPPVCGITSRCEDVGAGAPWYVVPADRKWFSRLATAAVLVTALDAINPSYPAPDPADAEQMAQVREELAAELRLGS
jgi:hypothetical protein